MANASVTITGTPEAPILNFDIPQGEKGDPGGIVSGTDLGTIDLNTITTAGTYRCVSSANATLPNNYPVAGKAGSLVVFARDTNGPSVIQTYYPYNGANGFAARHFYQRWSSNGTTWFSWKVFTSSRVDQTAGRAIYQWDDVNDREQLIYGDTGWRDMALDPTYGIVAAGDFFGTPSGGSVTAGTVRIRRIGNTVYIGGNGAIQAKQDYSTTTKNLVILPPGFRSSGNNDTIICKYGNNGGDTGQRLVFVSPGAFYASPAYVTAVPLIDANWNGTSTGQAYPKLYHGIWLYGSWITNDTWPTTLPGNAFGTVTNL